MRRIIESVIGGLIVAFLLKGVEKYGGINIMKSIYQTFMVELWPIWIGLLTALLYWTITDYIKLRRFCNFLEKWIGFFSYPDKNGGSYYSDLKGKIKRYIQEELEKESKGRMETDREIIKMFTEQLTDIQTRIKDIPMKAISG